MPIYRFNARLQVFLQDGSRVERMQEIPIDASSEAQAQSWIPTIASDMCLDAGSRWFDAPPDTVRVVWATRIQPP